MTLVKDIWPLPTPDSAEAAGRSLVERPDANKGRDWHGALTSFIAESDRALDLFASFMPEVRALDDSETLTFLHGTISDRPHRIAVPETPVYLDALLVDTPLTGGLEPRLGGTHLRTLTVLGFPSISRPGILDALNHQDFGYRWVTRFLALDKGDATKALTKLRRQATAAFSSIISCSFSRRCICCANRSGRGGGCPRPLRPLDAAFAFDGARQVPRHA